MTQHPNLSLRKDNDPFEPDYEEEEEIILEGPELDRQVGLAWRLWFDMYEKKLIEYLSAGSYPKTGELTMIVRELRGETTYCTAPKYEEVANMFIQTVQSIRRRLNEKLSK